MSVERVEAEDGLLLRFSGTLVISHAEPLAAELLDVLTGLQGPVVLDFSRIESADVSFLQVTLSFLTSLKKRGVAFSLLPLDQSHPVAQTAHLLGFSLGKHFGAGAVLP